MVNKWLLSKRRDLFVRDLVENFILAKIFFDRIYKTYKKEKKIDFEEMDYWVGTEVRQGTLWILKDQCHALFRDNKSDEGLCGYLFDWTFGSLFHECMKLKENIYQIKAYKPVNLQFKEKQKDKSGNIKEMLGEVNKVIEKAEQDLTEGIEGVHFLFAEGATQIKKIFPNYSQNGLLVRFLVEYKELVDQAFGNGSLQIIIDSMYVNGYEAAYVVIGKNYLDGFWHKEAVAAFSRALEINPNNITAKKGLAEAESKIFN